MKKILVLNTKYRNLGGEDTNILEEIKLLSSRYDVEYLEFCNSSKVNIFDLISFVTNSNLKSNRLLKKKIREFSPDVVYVHNLWFKGSLGTLKILKSLQNITVLHKIHSFRYFCTSFLTLENHLNGKKVCYKCGATKQKNKIFNKYFTDSFLKSIFMINFGKKYKKIIKNSNFKYLVLNSFHKKELIKFGVSSKNISIFYNPIEFSSNPTYKINSTTVVYAGRLTKNKGLKQLLKTWKNLNPQYLKLLIIGDGELKINLQKKYESKSIEFLGELNNLDTKEYIKNSKAVITCTEIFEGQPRLLSEAASYGVPSIFPIFGGMSEYFPNKYVLSFIQFDYEDLKKKIKLIDDDDLMKELSNKVFKYSNKLLNKNQLLGQFELILNDSNE